MRKAIILMVMLVAAAMAMALVRNPVLANKSIGTITIEAGKSITKTVYLCDPNGAYSGNLAKLSIYSKSTVGAVVIGATISSAGPHLDPNCPECVDDVNTLWAQADITISASDLDIGTQTIWLVAEDQQAEPNLILRNQDYKKIVVNVTKRVDVTPPCIVGF